MNTLMTNPYGSNSKIYFELRFSEIYLIHNVAGEKFWSLKKMMKPDVGHRKEKTCFPIAICQVWFTNKSPRIQRFKIWKRIIARNKTIMKAQKTRGKTTKNY